MVTGARSFSGGRRLGRVVDLTHDVAPTLFLLRDPRPWRQRMVQSFTYRDATHVRVRTSYQVELPPAFLERFVPRNASRANLLLPLTTRAKRPLLDFDVVLGDGQPGLLLLREAGADIQTRHLLELRDAGRAAAEALAGLTADLLRAVSVFVPGIWNEFDAHLAGDRTGALAAYLSDGLGVTVGREDVERWTAATAAAGRLIRSALREPPDPTSASDEVLLALPMLERPPRSRAAIGVLVGAYARAVEAADAAGDRELLTFLGVYGRRWQMFVEADLPTDRPTILKLAEDRPIGMSRGGRVAADVVLGDAASVHFQARVADPHVAIGPDFDVADPLGEPVGIPPLESARVTDEALALYTSTSDRPYHVTVRFGFRAAPHLAWVAHGVLAVMATAIVATLLMDGSEIVGRLALVLLPATFAAAFVLAREETPLAARMLQRHRRRIGAAVGALWLIALARVLAMGTVVPRLWEALQRVLGG